jgi:hypothetical protein
VSATIFVNACVRVCYLIQQGCCCPNIWHGSTFALYCHRVTRMKPFTLTNKSQALKPELLNGRSTCATKHAQRNTLCALIVLRHFRFIATTRRPRDGEGSSRHLLQSCTPRSGEDLVLSLVKIMTLLLEHWDSQITPQLCCWVRTLQNPIHLRVIAHVHTLGSYTCS